MEVVVVGGGVVGLTTALELVKLQCKVTVLAASYAETCSHAAGAWYIPDPSGIDSLFRTPRYASWARRTDEMLRGRKGCQRVQGVRAYSPGTLEGGTDDLAKLVKSFQKLEKDVSSVNVPVDFAGVVVTFETWTVKMEEYLAELRREFEGLGGCCLERAVTSLDEVLSEFPNAYVVNCAGLAGASLAGEEDMWPVKGQTLLVEAPEQKEFFSLVTGNERPTYVLPQGDGTAILGGLELPEGGDFTERAQRGSRREEEVDPRLAEEMLRDCSRWCPALRGARPLRHTVGWRPFRRGGARVERDKQRPKVVHNYGHGAVGLILSWGSALEVAQLLGFSSRL